MAQINRTRGAGLRRAWSIACYVGLTTVAGCIGGPHPHPPFHGADAGTKNLDGSDGPSTQSPSAGSQGIPIVSAGKAAPPPTAGVTGSSNAGTAAAAGRGAAGHGASAGSGVISPRAGAGGRAGPSCNRHDDADAGPACISDDDGGKLGP